MITEINSSASYHLLNQMGLTDDECRLIYNEVLIRHGHFTELNVLIAGIEHINGKVKSLEGEIACMKQGKSS